MRIPISQAKGRLTHLVRRAEAGDEIILTRNGKPTVRLMPLTAQPDRQRRRQILLAARAAAITKAKSGESAARSQDFLYDKEGLPK